MSNGRGDGPLRTLGPFLLLVLIGTFAYVSLRVRINETRDRVGPLEAEIAKLQKEVRDLRDGAGTAAPSAAAVPDAPPPPPPPAGGRVTWRVPQGEVWEREGKLYASAMAELLAPGWRTLIEVHHPRKDRATAASLRVGSDGRVQGLTWIKAPTTTELSEALEGLVRGTSFARPSEALAAAMAEGPVDLTFEP